MSDWGTRIRDAVNVGAENTVTFVTWAADDTTYPQAAIGHACDHVAGHIEAPFDRNDKVILRACHLVGIRQQLSGGDRSQSPEFTDIARQQPE